MNKNKLSFESENLVVDYISFNLEGLMDPRIIAGRLSKYLTPHVLIDGVPSIGFHGLKKKYKVSIRQYTGSKGYWVGTKIIFSGKNASYFYKLVKTRNFDWSVLKFDEHSLSLGRIDLCFSRPNDCSHTSKLFDGFLVDSRNKIQNYTTTRHIRLHLYKIDTSNRCCYIRAPEFHHDLDPYKFCTLLQFLDYAQTLNYKKDSLGKTSYKLVQFRVQDFLEYIKLSSNYYQLKKLIQFFDELQNNSLIKFFSNQKYRSLVTIPEVNIQKGKQNSWIVEIWIADELFYYSHLFIFPNLFQRKLTKLQFQVQSHVIRTFSSFCIKKTFYLKEFLEAYPSALNN